MDLGLSERVALITGASGGIGAAIARCFADEGARVAVGYHAAKAAGEQLCAEIVARGGQALLARTDLGDPASVQETVAGVVKTWGRLDVLVTSAWVAPAWAAPGALPESTAAEVWQTQLRTNVEGTGSAIQAVLPHMRAQNWGRIVLVSSGAAEDGAPGLEPYSAAKAALHGLGRSLARSVGPAGILVNVVMPGLVPTERHRRIIPPPVLDHIASLTPTKRLATSDEVARVVVFLASAANGSVTGTAVRVSGGLSGVVP